MDAFDAIFKRRSIRRFKDKLVSDTDIEHIIKAAAAAPTARNVQPWEFIVVKDKTRIWDIADITSPNGALIKGAAACIVVFCQDTKYYLEDGCAATTQALLAAAALGIGSCWVAGDKKEYAQKLTDLLGVPKGYHLISLLALGYADEAPAVLKKDIRSILHKEKF